MTQRAFADPFRAKSICNIYNHVAHLLQLPVYEVPRLAAGAYGKNQTSYGEY
jgi:hypothetical protein